MTRHIIRALGEPSDRDIRRLKRAITTTDTVTMAAVSLDGTLQARLDSVNVASLLEIVRHRLGMDLAWMSSFSDDAQRFDVLSGANELFGLEAGDSAPLGGSFCTRVVDGRLPNIVADVAGNPVTASLDVTHDLGIGSYIGVPVAPEGSAPLGMLCCISRSDSPHLEDADVRTMEVVAALLGELMSQADDFDAEERSRQLALHEIASDIEGRRLRSVFQPIVDISSGGPVGVEALSRVADSPRRPDQWFDLAHSVGIGVETEIEAIAVAIAHLDDLPPGLYMSVNASPEVIADHRLLELVQSCSAERIVVELTEHRKIDDYTKFGRHFADLRRHCVRVAIDDVGAGFSSFAHVLELRPDIMKLDRSIVSGIDTDLARQAIAAAVIDLGTQIDASVVAEGIETADELAMAETLGVRYGQGYLLERPGPLTEVLSDLRVPQVSARG